MEVYSLIGTSGTGKSSNAIAFAYEHNISAIIDDGLLIHEGKRVAGTSAKFEKTMVAAVKRAIFIDDEAAQLVMEKIKELNVKRILVIGTSLRMVNRIAERLQVDPIDKHYFIDDILTAEEIEQARQERETKGTHIIPLSYKQLDQNMFQKMIQKGIDVFSPHKEKIGETTIVKPYFHRRLLAELRKKAEAQKEKRIQKRVQKEKERIYKSRRRYVYTDSLKDQYAKLIPELMNYINRKLNDLGELVELYYTVGKYYVVKGLIHTITYMIDSITVAINSIKYFLYEHKQHKSLEVA